MLHKSNTNKETYAREMGSQVDTAHHLIIYTLCPRKKDENVFVISFIKFR